MLWPRRTRVASSSIEQTTSSRNRRVWVVSDLDALRPITTQANAVKAYRMLLEQSGYASDAPSFRAEAASDFRQDLRIHLSELSGTIAAYRDELGNLREYIEIKADPHEDSPGRHLQADRAREHRLKEELRALRDESSRTRADFAHLVVDCANHLLHRHPNPIKRQRDESPYR